MSITSVTDLVLNFAAACRALVPALDYAKVPFRDGEPYDNWDRIAEPLFESLVSEPSRFAAAGEGGHGALTVPKYGVLCPPTNSNAWIALAGSPRKRFVALSTIDTPFDQCIVVEANALQSISLSSARFVFVFTLPGCEQNELSSMDLDAV